MFRNHLAAVLAMTVLPFAPALAHSPIAPQPAAAESAKYQADRQSILAMAGTFNVKFDFHETTAWQPDYVPIAPKPSGGHEVVRVIEDNGRTIVLQHILVVTAEGKPMVVKHWRQDWTHEPVSVLVGAATSTDRMPATSSPSLSGRGTKSW